VLDIVGHYYMPGLEELIPGSPGNYESRVRPDLEKRAAEEQKNAAAALKGRLDTSETDKNEADAAKLRADANPKPGKPENPQQVYADAVQDAVDNGRDPRTDPKVLQIADTITALQKTPAPKDEKFMDVPVADVKARIMSDPAKYPGGVMEGAAGYKNMQAAATAILAEESAAKRDPKADSGTWTIQEDDNGKPVEFNTKTGATRPVTGVQKSGTNAKATAADTKAREPFQSVLDKQKEAQAFAAEQTGSGDVGLILALVEATRPKAGFRMTQTEWNTLQKTRSTLGDIQALQAKIESGQLLTPVQRKQMLDTISVVATMAQDRLDKMGKGPAAGGGAKTYNDAEVQAAVAAHPGMTAKQIEDAYKAKGYTKKQ
jgi:hypothetical protein